MYHLIKNPMTNTVVAVKKQINTNTNMSFVFDSENTDYIFFKKEINEETAQLQNADGITMTAEEAKQFIATLP